MMLEDLLFDKSIKAKAKVSQIGEWLIKGELLMEELMAFTETQTSINKATCIEALEYATKKKPEIANEMLLDFVTATLKEEEPRIKWESARVIANIVKMFPSQLDNTVNNLLANVEHDGTVVRWATASAISEIVKLKTDQNKALVPLVEALSERENDSGVRKKYDEALKKVRK